MSTPTPALRRPVRPMWRVAQPLSCLESYERLPFMIYLQAPDGYQGSKFLLNRKGARRIKAGFGCRRHFPPFFNCPSPEEFEVHTRKSQRPPLGCTLVTRDTLD